MELKRTDEQVEQDARVQELYARWLDRGSKAGFAVCVITLLVYVSGARAPQLPMERIAALWHLPVARFLETTGAPKGWGWINLVGYGDYFNFVGIAIFASVSIACYLRVLPALIGNRDRVYASIALVQILVLLLAASGLLNSLAGG
jgi:hypothetical protein